MIYDEPVIPEIRETAGDPWRALAAAVAERGLDDLTCRHRILRTDAARFVTGAGFGLLLELSGVQIGADACRVALRRRGVLPDD
jgi:hypothetical protein